MVTQAINMNTDPSSRNTLDLDRALGNSLSLGVTLTLVATQATQINIPLW